MSCDLHFPSPPGAGAVLVLKTFEFPTEQLGGVDKGVDSNFYRLLDLDLLTPRLRLPFEGLVQSEKIICVNTV